MKYRILYIILLVSTMQVPSGCQKFLEEKPDKSLTIPEKLQDLQALMDNYNLINSNDPNSSVASCDDYFLTDDDYRNLHFEDERRLYRWEKDRFFTRYPNDWGRGYNIIFPCNTALDVINQIKREQTNAVEYDNVKGQALFHRAKTFLQIAFIWSLAYDENSADADPGIPLRKGVDFNEQSQRSTVRETYEQVLTDLKQSLDLLPIIAVSKVRPCKPAAAGVLARAYLSMRMYDSCFKYANLSLGMYDDLIDLNDYPENGFFPIEQMNKEVMFHSLSLLSQSIDYGRAKIDSNLVQSYDSNDLRKTIFLGLNGNGSYYFNGNYAGFNALFSGIAVDEVLLMRAECYARQENLINAMNDLNSLLAKRWKTGTFIPIEAATADEALLSVLTERRKELLMRGLRWMDIKRLNKEGAGIELYRKIEDKLVVLEPNSLRYALPIPEDIIELSGMKQNPR